MKPGIRTNFGFICLVVLTCDAAPYQQAYVKASNTDPIDQFGFTVALSGNTLAVGAPGEASCATGVNGDQTNNSCGAAGAAYVYVAH